MMGSSQPATTTQIQKTELPAWVDAASQDNYAQAKATSLNLTPSAPQNVAEMQPLENQAVDMLNQGAATSGGLFGQAANAYGGLLGNLSTVTPGTVGTTSVGYDPTAMFAGARDVNAKSFLDANLQGYLNPYTQQVIDTTNAAALRGEATTLQQNADANRASGSWGGSRDAISGAVIQANGINNRAQTNAQLQNQNFMQAQAAIAGDQNRDLTAQQSNQSADTAKGQINANIGIANSQGKYGADAFNSTQKFNADSFNVGNKMTADQFNASQKSGAALAQAQGLAGLGSSVGQMSNAQSLLAANLGQSQRANVQAFMDAQQANAGLGNQDATNALNMRLAALGMSPYGKTTTSNSVSQGGQSSNTGMQVLGGAMSILPMLFSDRRVKKDIKRVGKVGNSDLNKYEYRYKKGFMGNEMGDDKYIGVMAQDVEKKLPGAVHKVNVAGKKIRAVDYGMVAQHGFMGN